MINMLLLKLLIKTGRELCPILFLVAPGGEIVYSHQGVIDVLEVKKGDHEEDRKIFCR